jgi:hypothetical protein
MIGELIFAICALGIVIGGILIMIQAITFEQLLNAVGRLLLFVGLVLASAYVPKMVLLSVIVPWLVSLKAHLFWLAIGVIAIILLALIVRVTVSNFQH